MDKSITLNFIPDYDALKRDPEFQRAVDGLAAQHDQLANISNDELRELIGVFVAAVFRHARQEDN